MPKILIADDDRVISHLVSGILRREGYEVVAAMDAMQTVMFAMRAPQPDAIVLDLQMPGGTGLEALRKLKGSTKTSLIPVILLSGSADAADRQRMDELGVVASLHKPVDAAALLEAVAEAAGAPPRKA